MPAGVDHLIAEGIADPERLGIVAPGNGRQLSTSLETVGAGARLAVYPEGDRELDGPADVLEARERMAHWFERHLRGRDVGAVGELVEGDEWSLLTRSAKRVEEIGGSAAPNGWLVVDLVLASSVPVEGKAVALTGSRSPFRLEGAGGGTAHPAGVPVEWSGGEHLLRGEQSVVIDGLPDEDTAAWPFRIAFDLEGLEPPAQLLVMDLPPVSVHWIAPPPPARATDDMAEAQGEAR